MVLKLFCFYCLRDGIALLNLCYDQNVRQLCGRVCMYLVIYLKEF